MKLWVIGLAASFAMYVNAGASAAPPKVQFSREVLPVLVRECGSCHRGSAAPGGYSLESAALLMKGGRHGAAVLPGKSADSTLIKYLTGELKPQMPPGKPLALDTIARIRRWIDEGARIDSMTLPAEKGGILRGAMPMRGSANLRAPTSVGGAVPRALLPSVAIQMAPVTAVVFSPDGATLAVGGFRSVRLVDPADGAIRATLAGPADQVVTLAWTADGKRLAAGGGMPGASGEVCVWEVPASGAAWGKPRILKEHTEVVLSAAWRPDGVQLATGSQDKTARVWDIASGKTLRTLKDHVDFITAVAYSPDGKWLATAGMDRSVKLYSASDLTRSATLPHAEGITALAFSSKSDLIATAAADKQVRVWPVRAGTVENPLRQHGEGEAVSSVAFSADGKSFVWGAINRKIQLWNGDVSGRMREMNDAQDWVYAVALSPDGKRIAAGAGDGKLYLWNAADGKLERAVPMSGQP